MYNFVIVPACNVDLTERGSLFSAYEASNKGYKITSDNPVHRALLDKLFNK